MHIKDQLDALIEELRFHDINEDILNAMKKIKRHLFVLGKFKDEESKILKKISKTVLESIEVIIKEGKEKAMSIFNAG